VSNQDTDLIQRLLSALRDAQAFYAHAAQQAACETNREIFARAGTLRGRAGKQLTKHQSDCERGCYTFGSTLCRLYPEAIDGLDRLADPTLARDSDEQEARMRAALLEVLRAGPSPALKSLLRDLYPQLNGDPGDFLIAS